MNGRQGSVFLPAFFLHACPHASAPQRSFSPPPAPSNPAHSIRLAQVRIPPPYQYREPPACAEGAGVRAAHRGMQVKNVKYKAIYL